MNTEVHQTPDLAQATPEAPRDASNGAHKAPGSEVTGLPPLPDRVRRRAVLLIGGRQLSPQQLTMVAVTAHLIVHMERASRRLMAAGEVSPDGEPRALLRTVQDLARQIKGNVEAIFGSDPGDPIGEVVRGGR